MNYEEKLEEPDLSEDTTAGITLVMTIDLTYIYLIVIFILELNRICLHMIPVVLSTIHC